MAGRDAVSQQTRSAVPHRFANFERCGEPDPIAVELAIKGDRPVLYSCEIREVVRVLTGRGWSARRIAEHIGCASRTVVRHRVAGVTTMDSDRRSA